VSFEDLRPGGPGGLMCAVIAAAREELVRHQGMGAEPTDVPLRNAGAA
jgi:hypothetical protein